MRSRFLPALAFVLAATTTWAGLSPEVDKALHDAPYIYLQSQRKSGDFGKPAEIWFFVENGAVYLGTRPTSWRVKSIKAGRTKARIAVGQPHAATLETTGSPAHEPTIERQLLSARAQKETA